MSELHTYSFQFNFKNNETVYQFQKALVCVCSAETLEEAIENAIDKFFGCNRDKFCLCNGVLYPFHSLANIDHLSTQDYEQISTKVIE